MAKFNPITFTLAEDNKKVVVADRYVPNALLMQNKPIYEAFGGKRIEGIKECRIEFPTAAKAKKFAEQAICKMSAKEYKAARKVAEGTEKPKVQAKGNARKAKGNGNAPTKAITQATKGKDTTKGKEVKKGKGNAPELTEAGKKALEKMKTSVLNRAAAAYDRANGGNGVVTFASVGKSAKELSTYIPKAKADVLKSTKWAKASEAHGLTEDMLG